ncbi:MAG: helix-turn-helix domain-containing protein [Propionibacteriaceae bacterium]|jgi:transposase-like protein|nr:helix-turn-helix domain-containing protein [Propionibacteriaceae bacterium]
MSTVHDSVTRLQALLAEANTLLEDIKAATPAPVDADLVTISQACRLLGISRSTIYKWHHQWEHDQQNGSTAPRGIRIVYPARSTMPRIRRQDVEALIHA